MTAALLTTTLLCAAAARAKTQISVQHVPPESAQEFHFIKATAESKAELGSIAKFRIIEGEIDSNSGGLRKLHDHRLPSQEDQPDENFFFNAGVDGGRILVDLQKDTPVSQIVTYSWHPGSRAPQVYRVYGIPGKNHGKDDLDKNSEWKVAEDWVLIGTVDTRKEHQNAGGQYSVSLIDPSGTLGTFRFLSFDVKATEMEDAFGNTFFSEIEIRGDSAASPDGEKEAVAAIKIPGTEYEFTVDTSAAPELADWAQEKIVPMANEWYPKILDLLASDGFSPPKKFSITFSHDMRGVAATSGTRIRCAADWFDKERDREGVGAVFHEIVHVAQQYGGGRRAEGGQRPPGWLVEGIPDYLRWYLFEPQSHGAEISKNRFARAHYDGLYRITANFLNWVTTEYHREVVKTLNAALRARTYQDDLWKTMTGHTLAELDSLWRDSLQAKFAASDAGKSDPAQKLSPTGNAAGEWKSLFNGTNFSGWHNFKRTGIRAGWQVKDGVLTCVDPHDAGDIVTEDSYEWFELQLDYNISEGGNSGIMFHVTEAGNAAWATGPEFQLEDNAKAADKQRCGWLYALYQPPVDPKTGEPLDATKPAGQWNHVRLLITPKKCEHEINGVSYFTYVLGSDDFKERVAKSKFGKMPNFAKFKSGSIALQGDHGQVSFRNIKIRVVPADQ
jgi:hypothetical protein